MTSTKISPKTARLLEALSGAFPTFRLAEDQGVIWDALLAQYDAGELAWAAKHVCEHHRHGAPSVSHVVAAINGTLTKVEEPALGLWNEQPLDHRGMPATRWVEARVGLDGEPHPGREGLRELLKLPELEYRRTQPLGYKASSMVQALADGMSADG